MIAVVTLNVCAVSAHCQHHFKWAYAFCAIHCVWYLWGLALLALSSKETRGGFQRWCEFWIRPHHVLPRILTVSKPQHYALDQCIILSESSLFFSLVTTAQDKERSWCSLVLAHLIQFLSSSGFQIDVWVLGSSSGSNRRLLAHSSSCKSLSWSWLCEYLAFGCRPLVDPVFAIFEKIFCGRRNQVLEEGQDFDLGKPLPGSDPVEANRRR